MKTVTKFVVFGEALTDFIRQSDGQWRTVAGGACWNVARTAAKLGIKTGYAGSISLDLFGQELLRLTQDAGLDMRYLQQVKKSPLLAIVTSISPPDYFFIGNDSADLYFTPSKLPTNWLHHAQILHFGCISLTREPLASQLLSIAQTAAACGKQIAFDPNWRTPMSQPQYKTLFHKLLALSNYIKVSDEDLKNFFPKDPQPLLTLQTLAPHGEILFTRGIRGMRWIKKEQYITQATYRVNVIDTIGCGDAAMGGWIASILKQPNATIQTHLQYAAACAALTAAHAGAYAATWEEIQTFIQGTQYL